MGLLYLNFKINVANTIFINNNYDTKNILIGILFIILGLLYPFLKDFGFGKLPGDIFYKKENSSFYFPIVTCLIVSILISLMLFFLKSNIFSILLK